MNPTLDTLNSAAQVWRPARPAPNGGKNTAPDQPGPLTLTAQVLPAKPRPIDRCHDTGRVVIGIAHQRPPSGPASSDAQMLQRALLDRRTAQRPSLFGAVIGAIWNWC